MTTGSISATWWVRSVLGLACAALGAVLLVRPFDSLSVLVIVVAVGAFAIGAGALAGGDDRPRRWPDVAAGALWIALGVVVLAWPDITARSLALVVGVVLVVGGLLDMAAGFRGRPTSAWRRSSVVPPA